MKNIDKTNIKKKNFFMERFSTFSFLTLIPIVALMIFVFISMLSNNKNNNEKRNKLVINFIHIVLNNISFYIIDMSN